MAKAKKEIEVQLDENGISVETNKKLDWKAVGKKVLYGAGCVILGIVTYIAVGAVLADSDGDSDSDGNGDSDQAGQTETSESGVAD